MNFSSCMMKNKFSIFLFPILVFAFQSCLDAEKKGYLEDISGMNKKLDSLETAFKAMPNDSFTIIKKSAAGLEKEVKKYFTEDTVDHEFARKMNRLRGIRKGTHFISMRQVFLDTIFVFQRAQLGMLRDDIENGVGKRDEYRRFVESEKENMTTISSSFNDYKLRFDAMRNGYYNIEGEIRDRIQPFKDKAEQK